MVDNNLLTGGRPAIGPTPTPHIWQLLDADLHMSTLNPEYAPVGLLELVVQPPRLVLDIGCFCGGSGRWLKQRYPNCKVIGVEMLDSAARIAAETYDRIIVGNAEELDLASEGIEIGSIDAIVLADVLEHLYNPWKALQRLKPLLSPVGAIYISLPNVRNLNILATLSRGEWNYSGAGILDITHIRFFTYRQAVQMLEQTGWRVDDTRINLDPTLVHLIKNRDIAEINVIQAGSLQLQNLTQSDVLELLALQFFFRAMPADLR